MFDVITATTFFAILTLYHTYTSLHSVHIVIKDVCLSPFIIKLVIEIQRPLYVIELSFYSLQITLWDTGGLERYHSMTSSYFRYSTAVILVYDASDQLNTLCALRVWIDEARRNSALKDKVTLSLWANKSDILPENSPIPAEVTAFLSEYSIPESLHFFVSAKTGYQLKESFHQLIEHVYDTSNVVSSNSTNISGTSPIPNRRSWRDKLCNC